MEYFIQQVQTRILRGFSPDKKLCPSLQQWDQIQRSLGVPLNKYYMAFISLTGMCELGYFYFANPINPYQKPLRQELEENHEGYAELWAGIASFYPEKGGLMELVRTGTRRAIALPSGETGTVHVVDHDDMVSVDLGYNFDEFIIRILDVRPCQRIIKEIFDEMMLNLGLNIWIRTSKGRELTTTVY